MNTLDLLLQMDLSKLKKPTRDVEIKRLSASAGNPVIFTLEALTPDKMNEIQEMCLDYEAEKMNLSELQLMTIVEGIKSPNFKSKELMDKFGVYTPKDLVKKLLLPGEIVNLYNLVGEISGFDENVVEEIKN
ncbi:hypothetical protein HNQ80_003617 [Anaerosolibacter carboniphilus]|uniref:XkdN-like protein n=1 Tax=Anaerosolibacter carboniphilus TaxID=1417629 RepID=A0A841KV18_9FIRM|nr:XkdN-like protein [Anaerosolibacter carboniphilus]MBB6217496.1 hypothetical protein [Anaerosolibacter carboniphilus]